MLAERKSDFAEVKEKQMEEDVEQKDVVKPIVVPAYKEKEKKKMGIFQKLKVRRAEKKKKSEMQQSDKKEKLLRQTPSILPFLQIHEDYIMTKDGVMEIYQVESKDLYTRNDEDLQFLLFSLTRFYRSYADNIKLIAMNFPSDTQPQKEYWNKKLKDTDDPIRIGFINRKLFELDFLERERTNREFFLFLYAENEQMLEERKKQAERGLQQSFPLKKLSIQKKKDVLFVLNNQNTKV